MAERGKPWTGPVGLAGIVGPLASALFITGWQVLTGQREGEAIPADRTDHGG